ncbi:type II secretion system minor pseudopilin GspJ [Flocculibacter collagenilyticus]|uniref:type II secretion system minor pseudopilin GspJ n=1 Tax=Flocculibacter collagenilyticus TaxID=2744479 RepID=UPI0018F44BC9|nr:type II secretion system minor pseudopilin GspJ [Flocculibacter collagenilyticus]
MKNVKGFTLLEMIMATAIFALLGLASYSVLDSVLQGNTVSKEKISALQKAQFSFQIMEKDFQQASIRHIRIDGEAAAKTVMIGDEFMLESTADGVAFTRDGWRNPLLMMPRSELQSVAYRLYEGKLERLFHIFVDPVAGTEPKIQPLFEDVEAFEVEYFNQGKWAEKWQNEFLPEAVKVTIKTKELGEIVRIFLLPDQVELG